MAVAALRAGLMIWALGSSAYWVIAQGSGDANAAYAPRPAMQDGHAIVSALARIDGLGAVYMDDGTPAWYLTSGFYGLGQDVPVYFNGWDDGVRNVAASDPETYVSHWVATSATGPEGWPVIHEGAGFIILANPNGSAQWPVAPGYGTIAPFPRAVAALGVAPRLTPRWP
jgi:hypothetical protein